MAKEAGFELFSRLAKKKYPILGAKDSNTSAALGPAGLRAGLRTQKKIGKDSPERCRLGAPQGCYTGSNSNLRPGLISSRFSDLFGQVAEREGFEPPIGLHLCRISSAVHSTTLPPLLKAP